MKRLLVIFPLLVICGCMTQRPFELTNFSTGESLHGVAYRSHRKIEITMPDGEVLVGKYSTIRNDSVSVGFGAATAISPGIHGTAFGNGMGYTSGGVGHSYAILKSTKPGSKLMMEFDIQFDALNGTGGFGVAKTNDGREWKVTF